MGEPAGRDTEERRLKGGVLDGREPFGSGGMFWGVCWEAEVTVGGGGNSCGVK